MRSGRAAAAIVEGRTVETMIDPILYLTPLCTGAVLALTRFVGCAGVLGLVDIHPPPPPPPTIVSFSVDPMNPPATRNDFDGFAGMVIQPISDVQVIALGRWCSPDNAQTHTVKLVDSMGTDIPAAAVLVATVNQTTFDFAYADLMGPITLSAGQTYYLVSEEFNGGDAFLDYTVAVVTPSADFEIPSAVYSVPMAMPPIPYTQMGGPDDCYGPVNAKYRT